MDRYTQIAQTTIAATEWDMPFGNWAAGWVGEQRRLLTPTRERQANIITARYLEEYRVHQREFGNFTRLTIWGFADNMHWRAQGMPVLFDYFQRPKEMFWAFYDPQAFLEQHTHTITFITHGDSVTDANIHLQRDRFWGQTAADVMPGAGNEGQPATGGALGVPIPTSPGNTFVRGELVEDLSVTFDPVFRYTVDGYPAAFVPPVVRHGEWRDFRYGILGDMVFRAVWERPYVESLEFVSIRETARASRQWAISFAVVERLSDGSTERINKQVVIPGPNANLSGIYTFTSGLLEGRTLVFDIRNNGANIVRFELV